MPLLTAHLKTIDRFEMMLRPWLRNGVARSHVRQWLPMTDHERLARPELDGLDRPSERLQDPTTLIKRRIDNHGKCRGAAERGER